MAGESAESLPEGLEEWLTQRSERTDLDREELLARAVDAYRYLADGEGPPDGDLGDVETMAERLDDVDGRLDALESDLEERVEEVREQVVQVKREADEKAAADHGHADLAERVDQAGESAVDALDRLDEVEDRLDGVDAGFENYEEILDYLTDTVDSVEDRTETLARALIRLRSRLTELEGAKSARDAAEAIKTEANREGITEADCDNCDNAVAIGLLSRPRCPHCDSPFQDVEPASGFFGSARLRTGAPPALTAEDEGAGAPESPDELFEEAVDE